MNSVETEDEPVRLGVVTDIQYADKPDRFIHYVGASREYSKALAKTAKAVSYINEHEVTATLHLGDIVDGNFDLPATQKDLDAVLETLKPLTAPVWHVLGNHCLAAGREHLLTSLGLKDTYYFHDVAKWRIIVIDTVDVSVDREPDHPNHKLAADYLSAHSGEQNAHDWNGGLSPAQKIWLRETLSEARDKDLNVVVCGHMPVVSDDTREHLVWDADELHEMFLEYDVRAYFAGHYHEGGYAQRDSVHYVTFESILDSSDKGSCGIIELSERRIDIRGVGDMTTRKITF